MDIALVKQLFFQRCNYKKLAGFNSYSKGHKDILIHYNLKYPELPTKTKMLNAYSMDQWNELISNISTPRIMKQCQKFPPFEMFIVSFLFAFSAKYNDAIELFRRCQSKLCKSLSDDITRIFIDLQIAQLYERLREDRKALQLLKNVYKKIQDDKILYRHINNFLASCCVSIGLLCYRHVGNPKLASSFFLSSVIIRTNNVTSYAVDTYKHYLSQAFRYIGMMPYFSPQDSYIFLKRSYSIKIELYESTADEVIQTELFHLMVDFIIFLIQNQFKTSIINRISRRMLLLIYDLPVELKIDLAPYIVNISHTLFRYYEIIHIHRKSVPWLSIIKYFEHIVGPKTIQTT